jgi:hypothetical protein
MPVTEVFAAITVRDRDAAIEYYERLLGFAPSMLPNDDEAAWELMTVGGCTCSATPSGRAGWWRHCSSMTSTSGSNVLPCSPRYPLWAAL